MVTLSSKIIISGDGAVGKTTLVKKFLDIEVIGDYKPTIGVDVGQKEFKIGEYNLQFQIWDLSGQPTFSAIRKEFYSGARGGILVYDISRKETIQNIINWANELFEQIGLVPVVLVANKIDLREKLTNSLTTEDGKSLSERLSRQNGYFTPFVEASALHKQNNLEPFICLANLFISKHKKN